MRVRVVGVLERGSLEFLRNHENGVYTMSQSMELTGTSTTSLQREDKHFAEFTK
jgi:hypothetical protein